ncbi:MAG: prepilin-type N-terminal cleavage/methylation domain-containing protein, partial [Chloroflexi bacterium]|nr:prepilin-type N-terminal cleavage/methylation domain-containing protein [Chloroflexota bacterium]
EKGFTLLEVIVAMLILALIVVGVFSTISNVTRSTSSVNVAQSSGNLAASLMEIVKRQPYAPSYDKEEAVYQNLITQFPGYDADIKADPIASRDSLIQKITVTITYNGKTITTLEDYKTER